MKSLGSKELLIGAGIVSLSGLLKKPLTELAVVTLGTGFKAVNYSKKLYWTAREEMEDIIAEACYLNAKDKLNRDIED